MIGNDIIDLALAAKDSNWERPGFLQKIYTLHEQELIRSSPNPELAVWNLWSRKEAAYKILARMLNIRRIIPLKFECSGISEIGTVNCPDHTFHTRTEIFSDWIHTIAVYESHHFDLIVDLPTTTEIHKEGVLPFAKNGKGELIPISVSHHGRFHRIVSLEVI